MQFVDSSMNLLQLTVAILKIADFKIAKICTSKTRLLKLDLGW